VKAIVYPARVATRKQRARRAKTLRHEYGFVTTDEEGNEVEVTGAEVRSKSKPDAKQASAKAKPGAKPRGALREPQPPTWERAFKRGGIWGLGMIALCYVLLRSAPVYDRILIGLVYAAMFIPVTYWVDGMVYKRWQRRKTGGTPPGKTR
jgi:hypothetical protein